MPKLSATLNGSLFAALGLTLVPAQAQPSGAPLAAFFSKPALGAVALSLSPAGCSNTTSALWIG